MKAYERLISYTKFETGSDENSTKCPSTKSQLEFAKALVDEMKALGIKDANLDENGYVFGTIESNIDNYNGIVIGFIAHMDVVRDVPYKNIKTNIIENYDGKDIILNEKENIIMSPDEFDSLKSYIGHDLVVTDGTTLLGADNKAGIAEILTMAQELQNNPHIKHGTIKIGFTPDEEIGRGADLFQVDKFGADFAYTVDGSYFGEVEYETFNAAAVEVNIKGNNIHPGDAKNKMRNAILIGMEYNNLLPVNERPEFTQGYEGFYHLIKTQGTVELSKLSYIIRDHNLKLLEIKKERMKQAAKFINHKYTNDTISIEITDNYRNMSEMILPHKHLIDIAYEAVEEVGGVPFSEPVRGGTDGSRLSFMGLPCPNLGTGSHNHHGKMEYASIQAMDKVVEMLIKIVEKYSEFDGNINK